MTKENSILKVVCSCGEPQILQYNLVSQRYEPQMNSENWICDDAGWHCAAEDHFESINSDLYPIDYNLVLSKWHEEPTKTIATLTLDSTIHLNVTNPRLEFDFDSSLTENSGYFKVCYDSLTHSNNAPLDSYLQDVVVPMIESFFYEFLASEKES